MAQKVQSYNMMVAHSGDTTEFIEPVKKAVAEFSELYNKFNTHLISFEVRDFNDAMFTTLSEKNTQDTPFNIHPHFDIIQELNHFSIEL